MYFSRVRMQNWRSYDAATFDFSRPRSGKPVVLVGAMNGHGKTSFLLALYLGIFGRFGLRYCEGFRSAPAGGGDDDLKHYRRAIESYRRNSADPAEPTEIEVILKPTSKDDSNDAEIRIIRRWHFSGSNRLKQGEQCEELMVYVNDELIRTADLARAHDAIEQHLFPAHVTPAFIFDGEQAQSLIERMGEQGLRKAVEVMFGTKLLGEAAVRLRAYIARATQKAGGKKKSSGLEQEHAKLVAKREEDNTTLGRKQKEAEDYKHELAGLSREQKEKQEELLRSGAGVGISAQAAHKAMLDADKRVRAVWQTPHRRAAQHGPAAGPHTPARDRSQSARIRRHARILGELAHRNSGEERGSGPRGLAGTCESRPLAGSSVRADTLASQESPDPGAGTHLQPATARLRTRVSVRACQRRGAWQGDPDARSTGTAQA